MYMEETVVVLVKKPSLQHYNGEIRAEKGKVGTQVATCLYESKKGGETSKFFVFKRGSDICTPLGRHASTSPILSQRYIPQT